MAVTATPVFVQNPKITPQSFVNADGLAKKTIATAGANGSKVVAILASSNDTANRIVQLWLTRAAVSFLIGTTIVNTLAGTDGINPTANLLNPNFIPGLSVDNDGQYYLFLESGDTLQAATTVAITAAKELDILTVFGNF